MVLPENPVENLQRSLLAAALTDALGAEWIKPQVLIASNLRIMVRVDGEVVVKSPNWFYVPQAKPMKEGVIRISYTPDLEGAPVAVVMEFLSEKDYGELSVRSTPPYGKLYFYEEVLKVPTYVTYEPGEPSIEVRRLQNGKYKLEPPNEKGLFWIPELELFLGIWQGERLGQNINWLRWLDKSENLLLWNSEQAQQDRKRTERLAAKLRELGVDPDSL